MSNYSDNPAIHPQNILLELILLLKNCNIIYILEYYIILNTK